MSTEIKNTLFSFVTMRAPELSDEKLKEKRFVFRISKTNTGYFDAKVNTRPQGQSKWDALRAACTGFTALSETDIKDLNEDLYDFSVWMARNRSDYDKAELDKWVSSNPKLETGSSGYITLWQNLFYQVITQNDFYAKEAIIQMLVANNLLLNYDRDEEIVNDLMQAKVVLPKELFVEESTDNASGVVNRIIGGSSVTPSYPDLDMRNIQTIALQNSNIQAYKILLKELAIVEKKYRKEYEAEYKREKAAYDLKLKPVWDKYYKDIEDAKKAWCGIRDPKIPYDPINPCDQPADIPLPNVPEFIFSFTEEMDIPYLQDNLSPESFEILMEIVDLDPSQSTAKSTSNAITGSIPNVSSFTDLNGEVTAAINISNIAIYNATSINAPTYASYGGVVVPMAARMVNPFAFTLCYKNVPGGKVNFDLTFDVPDSGWQVTNFHCIATFTDGTSNTEGSPIPPPYLPIDQKVSITNIFSGGMSSDWFGKLATLIGTITFANGCVKTFTINGRFTATCMTGPLEGDCNKGTTPTSPQDDSNLYVPKGFGYKQLGIADYKIVEQTVHCYVEGEVAHIENVMARERREKSTRRLLKTETTISEKTETEKEKTTDTSTTDRYEMQSEVAQVIQQTKDFNASTQFNVHGTQWSLDAGMGMATHSSKEQNTRQAITNAKEVVQKATERITTKITEERIQKITDEFEENNIHEFDNRKGDKHVVGVYRWVDKIYKNQIVNFGKRLMFEFMVPEPAKLHKLGMTVDPTMPTPSGTSLLVEPIDPRKHDVANTSPTSLNLGDYKKISDLTLKYWAGVYNVEVLPMPLDEIYVGKSIAIEKTPDRESVSKSDTIKIDENYAAIAGKATISGHYDTDNGQKHVISAVFGNASYTITSASPSPMPANTIHVTNGLMGVMDSGDYKTISGFKNEVPVSLQYYNYHTGSINFSIKCKLTDEGKQKWQQECFKAIIDKYEDAKAAFDEKMGGQKEIAIENKGTNPAFFRQMMNLVLRKNCISYLIDQTPNAKRTYGKGMSNGLDGFGTYEVKVDENLDDYGAFVMFMEQAFEWSIMSYYFYPFYWADRTAWKNMYQFDASDDPLFRSFMQSGMARVIVTVRPGFEEAVRFYMQTGKIWNGGEVPVIEDKLFISIIEELREPAGKKEGKAWATRLPTSLTILQANSIGLEVEKALPCNCDDLDEFEDPKAVPCGDAFHLSNAQINGATGTAKLFGTIKGNEDLPTARVMLKTLSGLVQDVTLTNEEGEWELNNIPAGNYDLLLDATNVFPDTEYDVIEGSKVQTVTLIEDGSTEVNVTIKKK